MSRAERLAEKLLQDRELAKQREAARRASRREPADLDSFDPFEPANWVAIAGSDPGYLPTIPMRKGPVGWHVACRPYRPAGHLSMPPSSSQEHGT